jgi:hypothetical protein
MSRSKVIALVSTFSLLISSAAQAGLPWQPPGWPNQTPDPCGPQGCPSPAPPKLCRTVYVHECVNYQGRPPHCTQFQSVPHTVCS